jgi:hypothetical protein
MTQAFGPGAVVTSPFHPTTGAAALRSAKAVTFKGLQALARTGFRTVEVLFASGRTQTFALTLA